VKTVFFLAILALPSVASPSVLISQGPSNSREIALTFDAGADRGYALSILQTLERNHVRATFGMTGRWAIQNPDLIKRMRQDNDAFINHTYDHRSFTGLSSNAVPLSVAQRMWEVNQTDSVLKRLTGRTTKPYFRPPYGDYDVATLRLMSQLGYRRTIMWTVDSGGWQHLSSTTILQRCKARAVPGAIYLMHVGIQSQDAFALDSLIKFLHAVHYRLVTIPQLLQSSGG
jgi:peptidoglycan/xylan/chitin deacetylase (PgdA/CDA1 family)